MRFFKENSESIIRLIVNQIGITIFSFFLYTALGVMQKEGESSPLHFKVLISAFCVLFYFVLIYTVVWEIGAKDKIRIDAGRAEKQPLRPWSCIIRILRLYPCMGHVRRTHPTQ